MVAKENIIFKQGERMKDSRFYFLLGFMTGIVVAVTVIGCTSPLEANSSSCGEESWNPCYVKIVD